MENLAMLENWLNKLFRHIITPAMLKQPTVVILLMFFVSVTIMVNVGNNPKNSTTTTGKSLKDNANSKTKSITF